jgi:hypothetical protein
VEAADPPGLLFLCRSVRSDANLLGVIALNFACFGSGTPHYEELSHQERSPRRTADQWVIDGLPDRG